MRGRKPKPTSQQIAAGDPHKMGMRKLEAKLAAEPKASRGLPDCPRHLKGRARAAWKFWTDELAAMDLDRRPDAMMLEGACVNYARAVEADEQLARDGITVEESVLNDDGEKVLLKIKAHPAVSISNRAWHLLRGFCGEFGLSPVSRTRLAITKNDGPTEDLAAILSAPRDPKPVTTVN